MKLLKSYISTVYIAMSSLLTLLTESTSFLEMGGNNALSAWPQFELQEQIFTIRLMNLWDKIETDRILISTRQMLDLYNSQVSNSVGFFIPITFQLWVEITSKLFSSQAVKGLVLANMS